MRGSSTGMTFPLGSFRVSPSHLGNLQAVCPGLHIGFQLPAAFLPKSGSSILLQSTRA